MKQITPEIKARVFALYWNKLLVYNDSLKLRHVNVSYVINNEERLSDSYLLLRQITLIKEEDVMHIASWVYTSHVSDATKYHHAKLFIKYYFLNEVISSHELDEIREFDESLILQTADYLRSKYYALPAFGYSVDELVEAGVFKIKEVNND